MHRPNLRLGTSRREDCSRRLGMPDIGGSEWDALHPIRVLVFEISFEGRSGSVDRSMPGCVRWQDKCFVVNYVGDGSQNVGQRNDLDMEFGLAGVYGQSTL